MILYHGSNVIVEEPLFGYGKKENDYGQGFYCTEDIELAREWACQSPDGGFVNCYYIDTDELKTFEFDSKDIISWLAVLISNRKVRYSSPIEKTIAEFIIRNYVTDLSEYDLIKGYRADDSYFSYAQAFVGGQISVEQLEAAMKLGDLGEQIMIRSRRAFDALNYAGCEGVYSSEWYNRKKARDLAARTAYHNMNTSAFNKGELYMIHIIEEEVGPDDPRIQ